MITGYTSPHTASTLRSVYINSCLLLNRNILSEVLYSDKRKKYINERTAPLTRNQNRNEIYIFSPKWPADHSPIHPSLRPLHSIKRNRQTVIARRDLRRRVRIRRPDKRLLQRRRLPPKLRVYIVGGRRISRLRRPIVAGRSIQHVRRGRGALPRAIALRTLRGRVEQRRFGDVRVVIDVLGEALGSAIGRGR